jgi:protein SERAC1
VKAVQTNEDDHPTVASLHKATYGILFFGTPHKGLIVADMKKMLGGQEDHPRHVLLDEIHQTSNLLAYQLADFKNLIRDRKIVSFFETEQTRQLEWVRRFLLFSGNDLLISLTVDRAPKINDGVDLEVI